MESLLIMFVLFIFIYRFKTKLWDNIGKYKNSTLLDMVSGEHKVQGFISMRITEWNLTFLV